MRIEHWWFTSRLRLRSILRWSRVEQELEEELRFHLEHKIEEGIAEGLSPEEARDRALRSMGGLEQRKEEYRDMRRVRLLEDLINDSCYAFRMLRRSPGFSGLAILCLTLAIGATTAVFSWMEGILLRSSRSSPAKTG